MGEIDHIIAFIKETTGARKVKEDSDIYGDLGCVGDDFFELIDSYSKKFHVDVSTFLWYFHSEEEGNSIGLSIYPSPNEKIARIPVTPKMLAEFANKGKWDIDYPEHAIPAKRYDLMINRLLLFLVFGSLIYLLLKKC